MLLVVFAFINGMINCSS